MYLVFWKMLALLVFVLVLCNSRSLVNSLNDEGSFLMSFKQAITKDPSGSLDTWNYSDENPCSWNGITCNEHKVVAITIPEKNLTGFLNSSFGSLSMLRHVNLRNNKLFGKLPSELFEAQGLQSFVLSGNSFSGYIPSEVGKLKFLQNLDLSQNSFNGPLPTAITQCKRLRTLDLSQNNMTGSFPNGFGTNLISLQKLNISFNQFAGPIPSDLGHLSNLQGTVDLSRNLFSGLIPSSLGNLPEKVYIDLTYNNLSGPIPQTLINRGPTAFIENPRLCGPPLKTPCSPDVEGVGSPTSDPSLTSNYPPDNDAEIAGKVGHRGGLSRSGAIAIIVSNVIGICIAGLLFSYCYSRICARGKREDENVYGFKKGGKGRRECLRFRKDDSETLSENIEQYDLVPLDTQLSFNLDELLKASAFVLGKSGIGIVYKVVLEDGLNLAVRRLGEGGSQKFKEFQTEVEAIGKLKHPNIVALKAYYWSVDEKLLIYDYIPNGNLSTAIHGKPGMVPFTPLSWPVRLKIMKGIAKGLVYLHEYSPKKYVHGELKPSNILLGENIEPQISDFGLGRLANIAGGSSTVQSSRMSCEKPPHKQQGGASSDFLIANSPSNLGPCYQAPEALKAVKPSQKWDIYSYGLILLEIITGKSPIVQLGASEIDVVHWIQLCIEEKKPLSHVLDPYLAQNADKEEEIVGTLKIAMACVHSSPERRPAMRIVVDALERLSMSTE